MNHEEAASQLQESQDHRIASKAGSQYGAIGRSQALQLGVKRGYIQYKLDQGLWVPIHEGVYRMVAAPESTRQAFMAATLAFPSTAFVSHRAVAWLMNLPGGKEEPEVTVLRKKRFELAGVKVHTTTKLEDPDKALYGGVIPGTSPSRLIIDMAGVLEENDLEILLDAILSKDLAKRSRINWRIEQLSRKGLPGVRLLRELLRARDPNGGVPASVLESMFRPIIKGLPRPRFNHRIVAGKPRRVDADWVPIDMVSELDGWDYHCGRVRFQDDIDRQNELILQDRAILRYTHRDLTQRPQTVRTQIVTLGRARAVRLGDPAVIAAWMEADLKLP